ncbi:MAG: amino acid adenylation domain-containing protein, partial [Gammaproteobacteria bacterium]|nr:amino acid adenylation domain-containing protein [Gammaproteobacteria bacterium]
MTDRRHSEQPSRSIARRDATGLIGRVRQCWEEVLDPVSANPSGDFLGCGGDSLRAAQLCQRLQATLGRSVSPGWLLSTPGVDIAGLAAELAHTPTSSIPPADTRALAEPSSSGVTSFSQERMWFMHQLAPAGLAYNVSQALRLTGPLRADALEHAVQVVTARHPVLYSRFAAVPEGLQCLAPPDTPEIRLELIQAPASAADEPAEVLRETAARLVRTPFDLVHGPVFRAALIQAGDADAVLLLWAHHIVADQWAFDILVREIAEAYHPDCEPQPSEHPEMMPDFGAYAAWHRDWFQRERLRPELAYWRRQLQGLEPLILPADRPRPAQQTFRGRRLRQALDPGLRDRLQAIAAGEGATLAMLLLAALKLLLRAHCDRSDLAVGVPVANRQHPGAGDLVGTLVNTLVVRSDISACDDTLEVLAVVRRTLLEALEHQDLPFERLVQAIGAPRDTATSPLFTVMFNMLNTPLGEVHFEGLSWQRFEVDRQAAQFDLTVTVDADVDRSIVFEYSTDLFEPDSMARLAERYFHLLGRLAEEPRQRLTAELWLPPAEHEELDRWGTGPRRDITPATLQALVASALQRPQGMALQWAGERIPVTTLERQSAALAARLNRLGIGRGALVGVCLPRGPAMLVALLGVIRAGAAYVPLDPCYPADRLHYMAEDAALAALVANRDTSTLLAWPATPQLLLADAGEVLEADGPACSVPPSTDALERAGAAITGEDPAYVIYTSGSSGRPKGVVVPQAAVVNFLLAMAERPGLGEQDRLLAVTTPSFDIAVLELFLPLWTGATLVLAAQEDVVDGTRLAALIRKARITALQATPSTWRMLLEAGWQGQPGLKALVGGEPLAATLAYQLAQRTGEVWNMYGPTETTVWSSCWRLPPRHEASISLGSPILNTSVQVVDSRLQPCPIGVPGELLIGGAGVARGYLHEADLTTARFIALPGVDGPVYRTGDRVRWSADGALEYLGRLDAQVKLRGHRIELGEIEDRLGRHPAIAGAVAAVVEDRPGDARLLAYVVPWRSLPRAAELRDYLAQWLPSYMLPQHFVELDAMPLLPNGKVDRANLPAATAERVASAIALG